MIHALTLRLVRRHLAVEGDTRLALDRDILRLVPLTEYDRMTALRNDNLITDDRRARRARLRLEHSS